MSAFDAGALLTLIQQANKPLMDRIGEVSEEQRQIRFALQDQDKRMTDLTVSIGHVTRLHERVEQLESWRHARDLEQANLKGRATIIIALAGAAGMIAWELAKHFLMT